MANLFDTASSVLVDTMHSNVGEEVTVFPVDGNKREITVTVAERPSRREENRNHNTFVKTIHVLIKKDSKLGLIKPLERGLALSRTGLGDDEEIKWDYQHVIHESNSSFVLEFQRTELEDSGQLNPSDL